MRTLYKFLRAGVVSALFVHVGFAQKENVGIGTTKPDQSAILDLSSTNKGLLMPRVSLQQRNSIQNPANGLIVYQTDMLSGFYYYDGKEWKSVGSETAQNSVADAFNWGLTGNAGTSGSNFLGTTDNVPLTIKVNNVNSGRIASDFNANTYFGYNTGTSGAGSFGVAVGNGALTNNGGIANIAIGNQTLRSVTGTGNIGIGTFTLRAAGTGTVSGAGNIGIGHAVLENTTTGAENVGIGFTSLSKNVSGSGNFGSGSFALEDNNSGSFNVALGSLALQKNVSGNNNVAIGAGALGKLNGTAPAGFQNVAIGAFALNNNIVGAKNVAIGESAGASNTGSTNIFLGYEAGKTETASDKLYIANSATTTPLVYGDFATKYLAVGEVAAADRAAATSGGYRLLVKGGMITEKIKVAVAGSADWADYVFEPSYKLMSLDKVESFVKENKHLPNVPSAEEMSKNGLDVMQTTAKLMEKIEELTLYVIELNKKVKELESKK